MKCALVRSVALLLTLSAWSASAVEAKPRDVWDAVRVVQPTGSNQYCSANTAPSRGQANHDRYVVATLEQFHSGRGTLREILGTAVAGNSPVVVQSRGSY